MNLVKLSFTLLPLSLGTQTLSQECKTEMSTRVWKSADTAWLEVSVVVQNQSNTPIFYYYFNDYTIIEQFKEDSVFLSYILEGRDFSHYTATMKEKKQIRINMSIGNAYTYSVYNGSLLKTIELKPDETLIAKFRKPLLGLKKLRGRNILLGMEGHYFLKKTEEVYFSFKGMNKHYYGDVYFFPYHREIDLSTKVRIK